MGNVPSAAALALAEALERAYGLALRLEQCGAGGSTAAELLDTVDGARASAVIALAGAPHHSASIRPTPNEPAAVAPPRPPPPGR